jgi:hypothetical protein
MGLAPFEGIELLYEATGAAHDSGRHFHRSRCQLRLPTRMNTTTLKFSVLVGTAFFSIVSQVIAAEDTFPRSAVPNFTLNGGFPNWKSCRAKVIANSASCNVLIIGESTSTGHGSFFRENTNDAHSGAWPNQLAALLRMSGISAQTSNITGNNNIASYGVFDTRVTLNNWKAYSDVFVLGGSPWTSTDTSAFTFNPTDTASYPSAVPILTDTLDVYWIGQTSTPGGTLTVDTGGAPICSIDTAAPHQLTKTSCATSLGANIYNLRCRNANCAFTTIVARNSRTNQVNILNAAADGTSISKFNSNTNSPWDPLPSIATFAPALCIIDDIGNDAAAQTSIDSYTASLKAVVSACQSAGADVLLTTGLPFGATSSPIAIPQYQAAVIAVAMATNVPVWDSSTTYGGPVAGWTAGLPAGWNAVCCGGKSDIAHWSIASNVFEATMISLLLLQ